MNFKTLSRLADDVAAIVRTHVQAPAALTALDEAVEAAKAVQSDIETHGAADAPERASFNESKQAALQSIDVLKVELEKATALQ